MIRKKYSLSLKERLENLYEHSNPWITILKTSSAQFIMQIFVGSISLINLIFMKKFIGDLSIHGDKVDIGHISAIFSLIIVLGVSFSFLINLGISTNLILTLGKQDKKEANRIINLGIFYGFIIIIIISGIFEAFSGLIVKSLTSNHISYLYAITSTRILIAAIPCFFLASNLMLCVRTLGHPWIASIITAGFVVIIASSELIFFSIFKHSNNMKYNTIAISNLLGYLIMIFPSFFYINYKFKKDSIFIKLKFYSFKGSIKFIKTIISFGLPSVLFSSVTAITILLINISIQFFEYPVMSPILDHKETAKQYWLSLFGVISPIWIFCYTPSIGLHAAGKLFSAYCYGQKDYKKIIQVSKIQGIIITIYLFIIFLLFLIAGQAISTLLINNTNINYSARIHNGWIMLIMLGLFMCSTWGVSISFGLFQIQKKIKESIFCASFRLFLLPITIFPIFLIIAHIYKNPILFWISFPVLEFLSFIFYFFVVKNLFNKFKSINKENNKIHHK